MIKAGSEGERAHPISNNVARRIVRVYTGNRPYTANQLDFFFHLVFIFSFLVLGELKNTYIQIMEQKA
jgi:hypothetical protein